MGFVHHASDTAATRQRRSSGDPHMQRRGTLLGLLAGRLAGLRSQAQTARRTYSSHVDASLLALGTQLLSHVHASLIAVGTQQLGYRLARGVFTSCGLTVCFSLFLLTALALPLGRYPYTGGR